MGEDGAMVPAPVSLVVVEAPARLHLGLIDLHGGLGRVDGGIGVTLMAPTLKLEAERSGTLTRLRRRREVQARVRDAAQRVLDHLRVRGGATIEIRSSIPRHVGLGSGTQAALAAGAAVSRLYGAALTAREIALIVGRGAPRGSARPRSSPGDSSWTEGTASARRGRSGSSVPRRPRRGWPRPRSRARLPFPEDWRIVLAIPHRVPTVGGEREIDLFREHCPVPVEEVRQICHEVVMRLLPGVAGQDLGALRECGERAPGAGIQTGRGRPPGARGQGADHRAPGGGGGLCRARARSGQPSMRSRTGTPPESSALRRRCSPTAAGRSS